MSTPARRNKPDRRSAANPAARRPSLALLIAASVIASALALVALAQLTSPRGMFAALLRTQMYAYLGTDGNGHLIKPLEATDRNQAYRAVDAVLASGDLGRRHQAVGELLSSVIAASKSTTRPDSSSPADRLLAADPDNLISRLAAATIRDYASGTGPDAPPIERFDAMRSIILGHAPSTTSTLYNEPVRQAWQSAIAARIDRKDLPIGLAEIQIGRNDPHNLIALHHTALPLIQKRIADLVDLLRRSAHPLQADQAENWSQRALFQLITTETDSPSRLLCADLLTKSLPTDSNLALAMRRLRNDYHDQVRAAQIDLCDHASGAVGVPAVAPAEYASAANWLILSVVWLTAALGALSSGLLGAALAVFRSLIHRTRDPASPADSAHPSEPHAKAHAERGRGVSPALGSTSASPALGGIGVSPVRLRAIRTIIQFCCALAPPAVAALIISSRVVSAQSWSETWQITAILLTLGLGMFIAVLLERFDRTQSFHRIGRAALPPALMTVALLAALAAPVPAVSRISRLVASTLPAPVALFALLILLAALAHLVSRATPRAAIRPALKVWLVFVALGFFALQVHRDADRKYQDAYAAARADEFAARLGPGWQDRYLTPFRAQFETHAP